MNLAKESFYTLVFQVSGFLCAMITGMIVARELGPANKGIIAVALLYPSFFFVISSLSLGVGINHHMGRKEYDVKTFVGSALVVFTVVSVCSLACYFFTIAVFGETLYKGIDLKYLATAGFMIPFGLMLYFFSSILQGTMDIKAYNIANQLSAFSNLSFVLAFVALWKLTPLAAIIAAISGIVLGGIFALYKVIRKTKAIAFDRSLTRSLIKDGAKIHIGSIATFVSSQANLFILNYYATPSEVGFYSLAFSLANVLFFFSISLEIGLYPKVAHATEEDAIRLVQVATRQILLLTGSAALIMAVFSKIIVLGYGGKDFLPSVTPLLLLLPGFVAFIIPKILATLWVRKGWFLVLTTIASITAVLSLVLNFLLIPRFGASGAAAATTATFLCPMIIGLFLFWKHVSKDLMALFVPTRQDMALYKDLFLALKR
jgi:O-antigen/teichoic acid export membrane protein